MTIKVILISLGIFISNILTAQSLYLSNQEYKFVDVYMTFKKLNYDTSPLMDSLMQVHDIKQEDYQHILMSRIKGHKVPLNKSNTAFIADLEKYEKMLALKKMVRLKQLCKTADLSFEVYETMLKKYKSDIQYQRSLKPYFDHYINSQR